MTVFDKSSLVSLLQCSEKRFMLYLAERISTIYCIQDLLLQNEGGISMKETEKLETQLFLRRAVEQCYDQGDMEEAVRLGRGLDELQCRLIREAMELRKAAV